MALTCAFAAPLPQLSLPGRPPPRWRTPRRVGRLPCRPVGPAARLRRRRPPAPPPTGARPPTCAAAGSAGDSGGDAPLDLPALAAAVAATAAAERQRRREAAAAAAAAPAPAAAAPAARPARRGPPAANTYTRYPPTVFRTLARWERHRQPVRYARHVLSMARSGVVRRTRTPLAFLTAVAAAVLAYNELLVPAVARRAAAAAASAAAAPGAATGAAATAAWALPVASLPLSPFTLTAGALGLCLVFRTNASYGRWYEACRQLGALGRMAVNVGRQAGTWLATAPACRERIDGLLVAFLRSVAADLCRYDVDETHGYVTAPLVPADAARIRATGATRSALILYVLSDAIGQSGLTEKRAVTMDTIVGEMLSAAGSCGRIGSIPIPLSYSRHTSRFLAVWLTALPLALYPQVGGAMLVVAPVIGFFLLGLDDIGVRIEEGWNQLPVDFILGSAETIIGAFREADAPPGGGGRV